MSSTGKVVALTDGRVPFTVLMLIELDGDAQPWSVGDEVDLLRVESAEAQRLADEHESSYIAGAAAQWKSIARQAVRELRSYGVEVEYREAQNAGGADQPAGKRSGE